MSLAEPSTGPLFPPLLRGEEVAQGQDPVALAASRGADGADPGLVAWGAESGRLSAALLLAPEEPLSRSVGVALAVAVAFADALGALAPPEVGIHLEWPDGIRVNGGRCGRLRVAAATADPAAVPDWLVVGIEAPFLPEAEVEPGEMPEVTSLIEEGCGEIGAIELLESWSRHSLLWIRRFTEEGLGPVHAHWSARAWKMGEELAPGTVFLGIDEHGGQILRTADGTELRPLTLLLSEAP